MEHGLRRCGLSRAGLFREIKTWFSSSPGSNSLRAAAPRCGAQPQAGGDHPHTFWGGVLWGLSTLPWVAVPPSLTYCFLCSPRRVACPGTSSTRAWQPPCLSLPSTCGSGSLSSAASPERRALPLLDWLWGGRGGCPSPSPPNSSPGAAMWCVSNPVLLCPVPGICRVLGLPSRWIWGPIGTPRRLR